MGVRPHGDIFGDNSLQSRAGQHRSHTYGKAVLAAKTRSPPAVQGSRVVAILNQYTPPFKHASSGSWRRDLQQCVVFFDENSREMTCSPKNELFARKSN